MKKLLLLTLVLSIMMTSPALAQSTSSENLALDSRMEAKLDISDLKLGGKIVLPDGAVLTPISRDDYASSLARELNISFQEATEMESTNLMRAATIYYYSYSKTYTYSSNKSFKADVQATIKISNSGSFRQIEDVISVSTRRTAGSGTHGARWIELDAYSDPDRGSSKFPSRTVVLGGSGYFEIVSTTSIDLSVDLKGFFSIGFSDTGGYIYESDTLDMLHTFDVYAYW